MSHAMNLQTKPKVTAVDNGIDTEQKSELAKQLSSALADSYVLYLKTQNFHWNVVGPLFYSLHKLTESQYQDLAEAIDTIAERIRALGFIAPGSFKQFYELSHINEETDTPTAEVMIQQLADDNETCSKKLRIAVELADGCGDVKTADLLTERIGQHEENTWMLRAIIAQ